jgi:hypothetical protein
MTTNLQLSANIEYHGVEIEKLPPEVFSWLESKLGMSGERWFIKGGWGSATIYFKDQRDHTLFLLAWGI